MKKALFAIAVVCVLASCKNQAAQDQAINKLNSLARDYVRLGLEIGQYDADFVDAYYGPDSLRPTSPKLAAFPKDSLLAKVDRLQEALALNSPHLPTDTLRMRTGWIISQLNAFRRRINIFSGNTATFDEESRDLFGVRAPVYPEEHYRSLLHKLDSLLPGTGSVSDKFQALANRFIIPKDKIDTVIRRTIAECRKRTLQHYTLPAEEDFRLEYVNNKSWSGYNWYKGKYQSLIQINTDIQIFIDRAIDVGSHESYPGHHVYNMLLEKNLYAGRGWVEVSLYPLFSPQSLIAEGSANYGIELAFPGDEKIQFTKNVLLPLAGLDTTGISLYYRALDIRGNLNYARNEAARGLLNGKMKEEEVLHWLTDYGLYNRETAEKSIAFIRNYRSYVINYNYGKDLVKTFVERRGEASHWDSFSLLLSNETLPSDLLNR